MKSKKSFLESGIKLNIKQNGYTEIIDINKKALYDLEELLVDQILIKFKERNMISLLQQYINNGSKIPQNGEFNIHAYTISIQKRMFIIKERNRYFRPICSINNLSHYLNEDYVFSILKKCHTFLDLLFATISGDFFQNDIKNIDDKLKIIMLHDNDNFLQSNEKCRRLRYRFLNNVFLLKVIDCAERRIENKIDELLNESLK